MARYGRVSFSISYVVDLDDAEMVDEAKGFVSQDVADSVREGVDYWIKVVPDSNATEHDIEDCLVELRERRGAERQHAELLLVDAKQAKQLESIIDGSATNCGRDECVFDKEVVFDDGRRMAIQVVANLDGSGAWTQGVLFGADGGELGCTEPGDGIAGEYRVDVEEEDGTHTYTATVAWAVAAV